MGIPVSKTKVGLPVVIFLLSVCIVYILIDTSLSIDLLYVESKFFCRLESEFFCRIRVF